MGNNLILGGDRMELRLFGGFKLIDEEGVPVDLEARKCKALLVWLALHQGRSQPRSRLAALLWEDSDESQARHSLRQALSRLRKALGERTDGLQADSENITLEAGTLTLDVLQFEALLKSPVDDALEQAVELYCGDFLEGFTVRSESYENWLMLQRSQFREQAINAMSRLLDRYLQQGKLESGVRLAIQLLAGDPLQEPVHRTLMQLYARLNRPAEALRQYRQCRRILFRELNVIPQPETETLYQTIRQQRNEAGPYTPPQPSMGDNETPEADSTDPDATATEEAQKAHLRAVSVAHIQLGRPHENSPVPDPEQLHQSIRRLEQQVETLTHRYSANLLPTQGDDLVVVFGLQDAHGTECEKAVRFALQILHNEQPSDLTLSAGIACGSVITDAGGRITGQPLSIARRLAQQAATGRLLLEDSAYRGLRLAVDAIRQDTDAWWLKHIQDSNHIPGERSRFVGRRRERRQLHAALEASIEDGAGETFLLRGEAGIGKTRLVEQICRGAAELGAAAHTALVLDFGTDSHSEPIPALLRQLLDLDDRLSDDALIKAVAECVGEAWHETRDRPLIHALFRLPMTDVGQPASRIPDLSETAMRPLIQALLKRRCDIQPRLIVVEDIHWADQHTLEMLAILADGVSRCPALLIITSRVEGEPLDPEWRSRMRGAPLTTLDLTPLQPEQALKLADQLSPGDSRFIQHCIKRSGGNPFFLEQLLWRGETASDAVPDSVQSLVLNRLDLLNDQDRAAAQAASILGQRFPLQALRHLLRQPDYDPQALLVQGLIRPQEQDYLFSHALIREGILASQLTSQRVNLHRQAASWYREREPALYARHLDLAGDEQAAEAYLAAARQAVQRFDFDQSLALSNRGLEVSRGPGLTAQLQIQRGDLLLHSGHISQAIEAFETASALTDSDSLRGRALIGLASALTVQDDLDEALQRLDLAAPLVQASGDQALQTELHYRRGDILFALGRVDECLQAHLKAEQASHRTTDPQLEIRALAGLADAHYAQGRMISAERYFDRCITLATKENRLPQELGNLSMRGLTRFYAGSVTRALTDLEEVNELAAQYGNLRAEMAARVNQALIYLYTDQIAQAEAEGRAGLKLAQQLGAGRFYGDTLAAIGEALVLQGQQQEGLDYLERAFQAAMDSVPSHTAGFIAGVIARLTPDSDRRRQAIEQGERLLREGSLSHNHLHFYQNLIELCLQQRDSVGMRRYCEALANYTAKEPLTWSDFYIRRGRLLADTLEQGPEHARSDEVVALIEMADQSGLAFGVAELRSLISG